ncbi:MAG: CAP domain-containing protein [Erythrobacter sp.]
MSANNGDQDADLQHAERANSQSNMAVLLDAHNAERSRFGVPKLVWSYVLTQEARVWAEKLAREGRIYHASASERQSRGENLWMGTAGYFTPSDMMNGFLSEREHFKAGRFPDVSRTGSWNDVGHYTQIVWQDTREVGCAIARGRHNEFLVCRYWPAGNIIGTEISTNAQIAQR